MSENIYKIWGERRRIFLNDKVEADLLYLKKNSFCSTHLHNNKINMFHIVSGVVRIDTEFGKQLLEKNSSWTVMPLIRHRFVAITDAVMIEIAFVNNEKINPKDIVRFHQGGRIIHGIEMTEDEMRKRGMLDL